MLVPHIIVCSLVKSLLNKRKLMVRHVLGGSKDIQGRSKGISRVSWKQVTLPPMQWKYVIWIGCAGCGALLVRWISRTLLSIWVGGIFSFRDMCKATTYSSKEWASFTRWSLSQDF
jgi:hypothetical protein